jgi:hypothetical protein
LPSRSITQCVVLLLENPVELDDIDQLLKELSFVHGSKESGVPWAFSGPRLIYEFRPEINGLLSVDTVDRRWPDHMGGNDTEEDKEIFGAWVTSQFGPITYPGGLSRAACQYADGADLVSQHQAFIRLRISYVFGGGEDALLNPPGYDPKLELNFITDMAVKLLKLPGALAFFNPGGEVLIPKSALSETYELSSKTGSTPPPLWTSFRTFEAEDSWVVADVVGVGQIDCVDAELCFQQGANIDEVFHCLGGLRNYIIAESPTFVDNDTIDGPDQKLWRAVNSDISLGLPPRPVVRFLPRDAKNIPEALLVTRDS